MTAITCHKIKHIKASTTFFFKEIYVYTICRTWQYIRLSVRYVVFTSGRWRNPLSAWHSYTSRSSSAVVARVKFVVVTLPLVDVLVPDEITISSFNQTTSGGGFPPVELHERITVVPPWNSNGLTVPGSPGALRKDSEILKSPVLTFFYILFVFVPVYMVLLNV